MPIGNSNYEILDDDRLLGESVFYRDNQLVTGNGSPVSGGQVGRQIGGPVNMSIDIFDQRKIQPARRLSLPTPYAAVADGMTHPSVLFFPAGWNGWRYWMGATPYPNADSTYENPCILVSNDGDAWEVPTGVTNPLVQKPSGGYNADTELVMRPDGMVMYMVYRERIAGAQNSVKVIETRDGITWSAPVAILAGTYGTQDYASPSVWYDPTSSVWKMISHNLDGGVTYPMQINATSGADIYSGWGAPTTLTITHPTGGRTWWHSQFKRLASGRIVGLMQDTTNGGAGALGELWAAESLDGSNFVVKQIYADRSHYRPSFVIDDANCIRAFLGRTTSGSVYSVWAENWSDGATALAWDRARMQYAVSGTLPPSVLWFDNFNRADGAIGTPIVGSALTVDAGSFSISSNAISSGSAGNNRALVSVGVPDYSVSVKLGAASGVAIYLVARAIDTNNYWRIGVGAGLPATLYRQRIAAGASASLDAIVGPVLSSTVSTGDVLRVDCRGRRMRVYVNDVLWAEWVDPTNYTTGVKVGLNATNAGVTFDDLVVIK